MALSGQYIEQQRDSRAVKVAPNNQESAGQPGGLEWPGGHWMGCWEDAECLAGSRVAWRKTSRKEVAKQLGGQQVATGRRMSRRAPRAKKTAEGPGGVKQPGGRRVTGRMPNSE